MNLAAAISGICPVSAGGEMAGVSVKPVAKIADMEVDIKADRKMAFSA
ncbi:MAG: hypothetical protein HY674_02580 [Chloroflexi bacterium]|nr:hypothetical protein [Chloroflexota bacterium]